MLGRCGWTGGLAGPGVPDRLRGAARRRKLGGGCPLMKPTLTWRRMRSFSLAQALRPEGSRVVAMSTPISFSFPTGPRG